MNGFVVTQSKNEPVITSTNEEAVKLGQYNYHIKAGDCYFETLDDGSIFIVDGYIFPDSFNVLSAALSSGNTEILSELEGHFSGLYISKDKVLAFNDRFGGKTIFWQQHQTSVIFCSRSHLMPIYDLKPCKESEAELVNYRWTSGSNTLLSSIQQLEIHHLGEFLANGLIERTNYWQLPALKTNDLPDSKKILATKKALVDCLKKARQRYSKVAVFLSGGVDSSILAALSKEIFDDCYLLTPIFKGEENPELENAKKFAQTLNLPLQLVEVDPDKLCHDLTTLLALKREPLRHYSSLAMMAMMASIPEEYKAVVYGEAADTLFGSNAIRRVVTHAKWKEQSAFLPSFALKILRKVVPGRANVLLKLKDLTLEDIMASAMKISYSEKEKYFLAQLSDAEEVYVNAFEKNEKVDLRQATQERVLANDAGTHFLEAELIAQLYDKHIISPFVTPEAVAVSSSLTEQQYFGDEYVKPILRELACEFYSRDLIYQRKLGFPVPFVSWLQGPLAELVEDIKVEREMFDGSFFDDLAVEKHYELFWLAINWQLVKNNFIKQSAKT